MVAAWGLMLVIVISPAMDVRFTFLSKHWTEHDCQVALEGYNSKDEAWRSLHLKCIPVLVPAGTVLP